MHPLRIAAHQPLTSSARLTSSSSSSSSSSSYANLRRCTPGVQSLRLHPCQRSSSSAGKSRGVITCSISKEDAPSTSRRAALITPLLAATAASFLPTAWSSRAEEAPATSAGGPPAAAPISAPASGPSPPGTSTEEKLAINDEAVNWRIYDATAMGEPVVIGKDKRSNVWEKVMNARIVYLGEAEQVPTHYDKVLEVEIVKSLRKRCLDGERTIAIAMEAFPCDMQEQLNQFVDKRFSFRAIQVMDFF